MGIRADVLELLTEKWGVEEALLRTMLWERHGCPIGSLRHQPGKPVAYCDRCGIDFGLAPSAQSIYDSFMHLREGTRKLK